MALNLTPAQRKKTFHLKVEQAVLVPSTKSGDKPVSKAVMQKRVANVRKYLSKKFGGYTSVKGVGGYYSDDKKKIIKEKVVKVTSFATPQSFKKNKDALLVKLSQLSKKWGQESMGYEHEGDLYYVSRGLKRKRRISPALRKKLIKNLAKARRVKARRK
jgi:hypothetical protein